jgi:hypothetical protein
VAIGSSLCAGLAGELVAIEHRQTDVDHRHVGPELADQFQRRLGVVRDRDVVVAAAHDLADK